MVCLCTYTHNTYTYNIGTYYRYIILYTYYSVYDGVIYREERPRGDRDTSRLIYSTNNNMKLCEAEYYTIIIIYT